MTTATDGLCTHCGQPVPDWETWFEEVCPNLYMEQELPAGHEVSREHLLTVIYPSNPKLKETPIPYAIKAGTKFAASR